MTCYPNILSEVIPINPCNIPHLILTPPLLPLPLAPYPPMRPPPPAPLSSINPTVTTTV